MWFWPALYMCELQGGVSWPSEAQGTGLLHAAHVSKSSGKQIVVDMRIRCVCTNKCRGQ